MVIDAHTHIGYWKSLIKTENILLSSMQEHNIDYAVFSIDASEYLDDSLTNRIVLKKSMIELNTIALDFAKKHKNLFLLLWIKPSREHSPKWIEALDTFIQTNINYIHGLKVHPWTSRIRMDDPRLVPFIELAKKYNLPILVHTAKDKYSDISILAKVAKKYPSVKFVAAHMQLLSDNAEALKYIKEIDNLYGDTAWVNIDATKKAIKLGLEDKIIFGSDNPIDKEKTYDEDIYQDYLKNKKKIKRSVLAKIMYKNAIDVYKLKI